MKLRIISDVHNEFGQLDLPVMDDESNTILVLAGDIGIATKPATYLEFLTKLNTRFLRIIYIMGNHEHYHGKFTRTLSRMVDVCKHLSNVNIVDKEVVVVDDVAFVCATLWTDFDKGNPSSMWYAQQEMVDFRVIRIGPVSEPWRRKFRPIDAHTDFNEARSFIFDAIPDQQSLGRTVVVVTHHAPSHESAAVEWRASNVAGAYASDLQQEIINAQPTLWIHGHMHSSSDYTIGDTRVIANPRGYYGNDINSDFDPNMIVNV